MKHIQKNKNNQGAVIIGKDKIKVGPLSFKRHKNITYIIDGYTTKGNVIMKKGTIKTKPRLKEGDPGIVLTNNKFL